MSENELPEWTTELDEEILKLLNTELILTPTVIAENIGRSRGAVARRLNTLEAGGLVKKIDRGKYQITVEGTGVVPGGFNLVSEEDVDDSLIEDIWKQRQIEKEFGMTREEYFSAVSEEHVRLQRQNPDSEEDLLEKAFEIVEDRHRKEGQ